jgi:integrase
LGFLVGSTHIQESTKQGNPRVARQVEAAHRTSLAKGEVGIREKKAIPTLAQFSSRIEDHARAKFEKASPKTWEWYRFGLKTINAFEPFVNRKLDEITPEHISGFTAHLQSKGWEISSVNSVLRAVRIALNLAVDWGVIAVSPKVSLLEGENHRERVISQSEEAKYLAAATEPLSSVATVLIDSGMRPEECFKLRWENVSFSNGRHGTLRVLEGKTKAARRTLPLTQRVRNLLESRWENAGKPEDGWIWPAATKQGHVGHDSIRVQHRNALRDSKVNPFVIYSLRHTFLTRLGLSGCDVWTLARIAGHSSTKMAERYVHPCHEAVIDSFERMTQHWSLAEGQ